jgi:hypothetical protein
VSVVEGTIPDNWQSLSPAIKAALAAAGVSTAVLQIRDGMKIYRVWGGTSEADGIYWSPIHPMAIEALGKGTYRNLAGLPITNSGKWLAIGDLDISAFATGLATVGLSSSLDGTIGGLPEIKFRSPEAVRAKVDWYSVLMTVPF